MNVNIIEYRKGDAFKRWLNWCSIVVPARRASPVMVYQYGDEERWCDALERELELTGEDILVLMPHTDKADKNTRPGVAGIFLLVPLFFMDISKSEQLEVNALTKRYNQLLEITARKECGFDLQPIPDFQKTDY